MRLDGDGRDTGVGLNISVVDVDDGDVGLCINRFAYEISFNQYLLVIGSDV